jgi:hypothetical protein
VKRFDTHQILAHPWVSGKANISNVNISKSISMNLKKHMGVEGGKGSKATALDGLDEHDAAAITSGVAGLSTGAPASAAAAAAAAAPGGSVAARAKKTAV